MLGSKFKASPGETLEKWQTPRLTTCPLLPFAEGATGKKAAHGKEERLKLEEEAASPQSVRAPQRI